MFKNFVKSTVLRGFIRKEIIQTLRDPRLRVMIFASALLQLLLFGYALTNEVKNVRLALYSPPQDVVAQEIYDHALASGSFVPVRNQAHDPFESIQRGDADAVLVSQEGTTTRGSLKGNGTIQLLINASNVLRAQAVDVYMQRIVQMVQQQKMAPSMSPLTVSVRMLYNPSMDSAFFTIPGIITILLTINVLLLTCTSIAKEKESGTFETILSAPIQRKHIILGKTVPFALVGIINVIITLVASRIFFGLPFRGSAWAFTASCGCYIITSLMLGILLSTYVKNQQQSMLCCFIFLFVTLMLSGAFFSVDNMPWALRCLSYINPIAHFTFLMRNILLKGGDILFVVKYCLAILSVGAVVAIFAFKRFRVTLS